MAFLNGSQKKFLLHLGELVNGVQQEELGERYLEEAESFILNLDNFLQSDLKKLFLLFNSPLTALILVRKFKSFVSMSPETKHQYYLKWVHSKIPLFRTAVKTLSAIAGWSYFCNDSSWEKIRYPGKTIGREHVTPTLLFGKEPWKPKNKGDEEK